MILPDANQHNGSGFTLTELLVGIAVVAILTSIALVGVSAGMGKARTTQCASNLRQIGVALHMYAADNGGALPPGLVWDRSIAPYLSLPEPAAGDWRKVPVAEVFICPEDERLPSTRPRSYSASGQSPAHAGIGVFSRSTTEPSYYLEEIVRPEQTIMLYDFYTGSGVGNIQFGTDFASMYGWLGVSQAPKKQDGSYYHGNGQNWLFSDGHVARLSHQEILRRRGAWGGGMWRALPP